MINTDLISERTINHWYRLGWEVDDTGWHAPEGWDEFGVILSMTFG